MRAERRRSSKGGLGLLVATLLLGGALAACGPAPARVDAASRVAPDEVMSFRGLELSRLVRGEGLMRADIESAEITRGHIWFLTTGLFRQARLCGLTIRLEPPPRPAAPGSAGPAARAESAPGEAACELLRAGVLRGLLPGLKDVRSVSVERLRLEVYGRDKARALAIESARATVGPSGGLRLAGRVRFEAAGGRRLDCAGALWRPSEGGFFAEQAELSGCGAGSGKHRGVHFDPALRHVSWAG